MPTVWTNQSESERRRATPETSRLSGHLSPSLRKPLLVLHVVSTLGWIGAAAAFLALSVIGLNGDDPAAARGAYLSMDIIARTVIVPLAFLSITTGVVQGVCTRWGLFRHYWIAAKLVITTLAAVVLLSVIEPLGHMADIAADPSLDMESIDADRRSLVIHSAGGIVTLLVPTVLSIYKPRGLTPWGRRGTVGSTGGTGLT